MGKRKRTEFMIIDGSTPLSKGCRKCNMRTHLCSNCGERIGHGEDECSVCVSVGTVSPADPTEAGTDQRGDI